MKIWDTYAFILDNSVIELCMFTVGGYQEANRIAKEVFGETAYAVNATNIRAKAGDRYHDDAFWHVEVNDDGTETETKLEPVPSEEDRIEAVETTSATNTSSIDANTTAIDDILVMLLDDTSDTDATT